MLQGFSYMLPLIAYLLIYVERGIPGVTRNKWTTLLADAPFWNPTECSIVQGRRTTALHLRLQTSQSAS